MSATETTRIADPELEAFRALYADPRQRRAILRKINSNRLSQGLGILFKNRFVIPKAVRCLLRSMAGEFPLRSLEVAVGYECNFQCDQCSCALNHDRQRQRLSMDQFKSAIDQAMAMGAFQFNLNGGEPLLYYADVLELCEYVSSRGCYVHMATNGFLMTREKMLALKAAGLRSFEMGLDSSQETLHDANRGMIGSFKKIMENTRMGAELGLRVAYNTVGSKDKIYNGDLLNTVRLAREMGVLLMITPPCVTGRWAGKFDVLLNEEEKWYLRWILARHPWARLDNYNGLRKLSCPAAREKMAVNPYGDVVSCPLIQIAYGNVVQEPLADIQARMLQDPFYLKDLSDGCLPSHDLNFIQERLVEGRDQHRMFRQTEKGA